MSTTLKLLVPFSSPVPCYGVAKGTVCLHSGLFIKTCGVIVMDIDAFQIPISLTFR
jgi:hypothetical protein